MTTPFSPSLISLMVSVDVKHHVYLQLRTSQPVQFTGTKCIFKILLENIIFMRFCCWLRLSKKIEKLLNEQPTHTITKCTLTGLGTSAIGKKSHQKRDLKSYIYICVYFTQHCFFLPLPHASWNSKCHCHQQKTKQKTLVCIREIQVHKLWTKVYSQKGLTAMQLAR